jgi:hypothetical protein
VSNSSSSSFIIGLGIITDKEQLDKVNESNKSARRWDEVLSLYPIADVISGDHNGWSGGYRACSDSYYCEAFNGDEVSVSNLAVIYEEYPDARLAVYDTCYGDDGDFCEEGDWEPNYDISYDFFPDGIRNTIELVEGCSHTFNMTYGAGRNG